MMKAYGLRTHIWNNNIKSLLLLVVFPILLLFLAYGLLLLFVGFTVDGTFPDVLYDTFDAIPALIPITYGIAGVWFLIAFFGHQKMIQMATKSKSINPSDEPRPYRLLENLCISRGITMPKLRIMETDVMNAFASGIRESNYTITLTRGLMNGLDDEELEAVIAHELSHIRNRDVRLLIIAVIFVGIFAFVGEGLVRGVFRTNVPRSTTHRRSGGGNAGALILFAIGIIAVSYLLAVLTRFALSRRREYMADAGAVELTKNPDAMIRALQKISGKAELKQVPAEIREMALENPRTGFAGVFATHPPIEKRIAALVDYAGGREDTESSKPSRRPSDDDSPEIEAIRRRMGRPGPWTRPR